MDKKILNEAKNLFDRFGIKKVTMSDIAETFQMSKKTLYKYFPSKEAIVQKIIIWKKEHITQSLDLIIDDESLNFEKKLEEIFKLINVEMSNFQIRFLNEIRLQFPNLYEQILSFRKNTINYSFRKLILEGIEEGHVRQDIDPTILIDMYIAVLQQMMTPEYILNTNYSNVEIYNMIIKVYFTGILTHEAQENFTLFSDKEK